ncbi:MAG: CDP-alcohol phosphatidyltransferase family protein [Chloroflexi bacterium]|nr:CDP-alcohol phosphatidyltransferase family protein [Chloroflexota bacterium]
MDGIVSRHVNRRVSRPLAAGLAHTPVTPNGATWFTLAFSLGMGALVAVGQHVAGGIGIQLASIIDGVDGDLARLTGKTSRFGAALDAIADRYADAAILGGMTVYAARFEDWPNAAVVGALALAGSLTVSYSRARAEAEGVWGVVGGRWSVVGGLGMLATRDVRLLVAAAGTVAGQCYWTLVVLGVASGVTVAVRLVRGRFGG